MSFFTDIRNRLIFTFIFSAIFMTHNLIFAEILHSGFIVDKVDLINILYDEAQTHINGSHLEDNNLTEFVGVYILDNGDVLPVHSTWNMDVETWTSSGVRDLWSWEIGDRVEKHTCIPGALYNTSGSYYKNLDQPDDSIYDWYQRRFEVQNILSNFFGGKYIKSPEWLVKTHWWEGNFPETLKIPRSLGWKSGDKVLLAIGYSCAEKNACGWWSYWSWKPVIINLATREAVTLPVIHTTSYDAS